MSFFPSNKALKNLFLGKFDEGTKVDATNKLSVSFAVESKGENIVVHQAFVTLFNQENGQSITFIAEPNDQLVYFATCKLIFWLVFKPIKYLKNISVDVKEHLEYNGEHSIEISIGDAILYPGSVIESMGSVEVSGLKDAPIKGTWSRKYMAKVSLFFFENEENLVLVRRSTRKIAHIS